MKEKKKENRRTFRINDEVMEKLDVIAQTYYNKPRQRTQAIIYLIEQEYEELKVLEGI